MLKIKKHLTDKKERTCFISCSWININIVLLLSSLCLDSLIFLLTKCFFLLQLRVQETRHNLTVNLTTLRVWCYACGKEVFLERKLGPHSPHANSKPLPSPQNAGQVRSRFPSPLYHHVLLPLQLTANTILKCCCLNRWVYIACLLHNRLVT